MRPVLALALVQALLIGVSGCASASPSATAHNADAPHANSQPTGPAATARPDAPDLPPLPPAPPEPSGLIAYYWQSLRGHVALLWAARPVADWLTDPATSAPLRQRLQLAQSARRFAVQQLALPDNPSYQRYAPLPRSAAVWNVVASAPDALKLHTWCFPITGCIGYRGYFAEADAHAEAAHLAAQGLEVAVYPVPAYSTLGYSNWLGGDPLLSTFLHWPEGDFVGLLFHELAHQQVYVAGDTSFNESYASAVERLGTRQWLAEHADATTQARFEASQQRRQQWRSLTTRTRQTLLSIYEKHQSNPAQTQYQKALKATKNKAYADFRHAYAALRQQWLDQGDSPAQLASLDRWVAQANNARFAAQGAYDDAVPAFEALFEREGRHWPRFHAAVRALAQLPPPQRQAALQALRPQATHPASPAPPTP